MLYTLKHMFVMFCVFAQIYGYGQKVLIIEEAVDKRGKAERRHNIVYGEELINVSKDTFVHIKGNTLYSQTMGNGDQVIITPEDSVYLSQSSDSRRDVFTSSEHRPGYPSYLLRHLQSFPDDTIVISGLTFTPYNSRRTVSVQYSWKQPGDSCYITKALRPKKAHSFRKVIPSPPLYIQRYDVRKLIKLHRSVSQSVSFACNLGKDSYKINTECLDFLFVLDLAPYMAGKSTYLKP